MGRHRLSVESQWAPVTRAGVEGGLSHEMHAARRIERHVAAHQCRARGGAFNFALLPFKCRMDLDRSNDAMRQLRPRS